MKVNEFKSSPFHHSLSLKVKRYAETSAALFMTCPACVNSTMTSRDSGRGDRNEGEMYKMSFGGSELGGPWGMTGWEGSIQGREKGWKNTSVVAVVAASNESTH